MRVPSSNFRIGLLPLLTLATVLCQAGAAGAAEAPDPYLKARDAFLAGRDAEVVETLSPAALAKLRTRSHAALWVALARARQGQRDQALGDLAAYHAKNKEGVFIDRIVDFYLGKVTRDQVTTSARESWQKCEASFYLGAFGLLFEKNEDRAGEELCAASRTGMTGLSEFKMAQKLLEGLPSAPCRKEATAAAKPARRSTTPPAGLGTLEKGLWADSVGDRSQAIELYQAALRDLKEDNSKTGERQKEVLRSRLYQLARESYEDAARTAVSREQELAKEPGADNAVAVGRFQNLSGDSDWDPLEKGLPSMVTTDLAQVRGLKVLERVELEALLRELKLSHSEMFDTTTAPRVGRLMRASRVVLGSFRREGTDRVAMDARVVSVKTGRVEGRAEAKGRVNEFFGVQKDLIFSLVDKLGVRLTQSEKNVIEKQVPTRELAAFLAYSRALDEEDRGNFRAAAEQYQRAASLAPGFREAANAGQLMARGNVSRGDLAEAARSAEVTPTTGSSSTANIDRLLERAYETQRLTGSGLVPDLQGGEANERRETRPAGTGTVDIHGRLP